MVATEIQLAATDEEAELMSSSSDGEQIGPAPRRRTVGPIILASVLVAALLGTAFAAWPRSSPSHVEQQSELAEVAEQLGQNTQEPHPRLLESDELASAAVRHAIAFHLEADGSLLDGVTSEEREELESELRDQAKTKASSVFEDVAKHDAEAGRVLKDLRLSPEQWTQVHSVLEALHDKRVQEIGAYVQQAALDGNGDMQYVAKKLGERRSELRSLADELIPTEIRDVPPLADGREHWQVALGRGGVMKTEGRLGDWHASLQVGDKERRLEVESQVAPRKLLTSKQLATTLWVSIASGVITIISIVVTVLSASLGPVSALVMWYIGLGLDVALCGTTLGIFFHPNLKSVATWVPCMIATVFQGMEAIWTFSR